MLNDTAGNAEIGIHLDRVIDGNRQHHAMINAEMLYREGGRALESTITDFNIARHPARPSISGVSGNSR